MNLIQLTNEDNRKIWVNPDHIQTMVRNSRDTGTEISFSDQTAEEVKDTPQAIFAMIQTLKP